MSIDSKYVTSSPGLASLSDFFCYIFVRFPTIFLRFFTFLCPKKNQIQLVVVFSIGVIGVCLLVGKIIKLAAAVINVAQ